MSLAASKHISWYFFDWSYRIDVPHIVDLIWTERTRTRGACYVGVSKDPLWRMHKISSDAADSSYPKSSMVPHQKHFDIMFVLAAGGASAIAKLEKVVIDKLDKYLSNKKGGGGRVRPTASAIWFLYLVCDKQGRTITDGNFEM